MLRHITSFKTISSSFWIIQNHIIPSINMFDHRHNAFPSQKKTPPSSAEWNPRRLLYTRSTALRHPTLLSTVHYCLTPKPLASCRDPTSHVLSQTYTLFRLNESLSQLFLCEACCLILNDTVLAVIAPCRDYRLIVPVNFVTLHFNAVKFARFLGSIFVCSFCSRLLTLVNLSLWQKEFESCLNSLAICIAFLAIKS